MIKLCIFDLDGTLIDSLADLAGAMNHALKSEGFDTHPVESYRKMVGNGVSVLADRAAGGRLTPEVKERILAAFSDYYVEHCVEHTLPYDGIPKMLDKLSEMGVLYAVNSNKPDLFSKLIVKVLFPLFSFAQVWGKKKEYDPKPSPDGVKGIAEELGVSLDEVLYIGDSDVDVYTAKNASVRFCGVSWGFRSVEELRSAGASVIADTPEDILRIVRSSGEEK